MLNMELAVRRKRKNKEKIDECSEGGHAEG